MSAPSEQESESDYLLWKLTQQPFFDLTAQYQICVQRLKSLFMLFLLLSLSLFLFNLLFYFLLFLLDLLGCILEEHLHINFVGRERCQQLVIQCLDLISNGCHLLGECLI